MPTVKSGVIDTQSVLGDEFRLGTGKDFGLLESDEAPFFQLLKRLPVEPARNVLVQWTEDPRISRMTSLAASATSGTTSVIANSGEGAYVSAGDFVVFTNSGEIAKVTGVTANSAIGVTRSVGAVAAQTAQSGTGLLILPRAHAQGADFTTPDFLSRVGGYNYLQVFRTGVALTRTLKEISRHGSEKDLAELAFSHKRHLGGIDDTLFFGGRGLDTSGSEPVGTLGGVADFLNGGPSLSTSLSEFVADISPALATGGPNKALFMGPAAAGALMEDAGSNWVAAERGEKILGVQVNAWFNSPVGRIPVFTKRGWGRLTGASSHVPNVAGNMYFLVDLDNVKLRTNRKTKLLEGRQGPGVDGFYAEYLTEISLEVRGAHAVDGGSVPIGPHIFGRHS